MGEISLHEQTEKTEAKKDVEMEGVNDESKNKRTVDMFDPLEWTLRKKNIFLAAMCYMSALTDFLAGVGVPMMIPQSKDWSVSLVNVSRSLSGNTVAQGFGSLAAVPFAQRFGVLPVMFWSTLATFLLTVVCAVVPDWFGFIVVRVLQGFFSAAGQVLGLTIIQEMFYFEAHVAKVGVWGWSVLVGPYLGPFISSFILRSLTWRECFWLISGLVGVGVLCVVFLMDETAYDRVVPGNNPPRPDSHWKYMVESLTGIRGARMKGRPSLMDGCKDIFSVLIQPHFLLLWLYHGLTYMWAVGINGTLITFLVPSEADGGYGFDTTAVGLIYISPITGIIIGELFGHFVNDAIQSRIVRRHQGMFVPEQRLSALIPATILMGASVSLLGWGLEKHWHWFGVAMLWGTFVFATMCSTVVVSAYQLDCFPDDSVVVAALLNFTRVLFGFLVPIFQKPWANEVGVGWSFTTQGAICIAAYILVFMVQKNGLVWRKKAAMCPDTITVSTH